MAKTSPKQPAKKKRNTRGMGSIRAKMVVMKEESP